MSVRIALCFVINIVAIVIIIIIIMPQFPQANAGLVL
jgi:hypothetical protein